MFLFSRCSCLTAVVLLVAGCQVNITNPKIDSTVNSKIDSKIDSQVDSNVVVQTQQSPSPTPQQPKTEPTSDSAPKTEPVTEATPAAPQDNSLVFKGDGVKYVGPIALRSGKVTIKVFHKGGETDGISATLTEGGSSTGVLIVGRLGTFEETREMSVEKSGTYYIQVTQANAPWEFHVTQN